MNPFATAADILEVLARQFPHFRNKISKAFAMGYTAEDIYEELSKLDKKKAKSALSKPVSKEEDKEFAERIQRRGRNLTQAEQAGAIEYRKEEETKSKLKKGALTAAGLVGGGLALRGLGQLAGRAGQAIIPEVLSAEKELPFLQKAIPFKGQPKIGYQGPSPTNPIKPQITPEPPISPKPNIVPTQSTSPIASDLKRKHVEIIEQLGAEDVIKNLSDQNSPKQLAAILEHVKLTPQQKKWVKTQTDKSLETIVSDYLTFNPPKRKEEEVQSKAALHEEIPQIKQEIPVEKEKNVNTVVELKKKERPTQDADITYPAEFFKGKKSEEISDFNNKTLSTAVDELIERTDEGEDFQTSYGDEWKAVGYRDVTDTRKESYPKREFNTKKSINEIIDKHVPVRGLYKYYFNTAEKRKKMPFQKFVRDVEKSVTELALIRSNPEKHAQIQEEQRNRVEELLKPEKSLKQNKYDDEILEEIEEILFGKKSKEYEDLMERLIKSIR